MRKKDFCLNCFRIAIALGFRYPFEFPMPGIMYNMDHFEKRLVDAHFDVKKTLPKWLKQLGCIETIKFPAKMTEEIPTLGLTLVGMPDAVFRKSDGSLCVVDYKTAKYKGADDPFMPVYEAQLWGYARLLESNGIGDVSSSALIYFENRLADYKESPLDLLSSEGLTVPFAVKIHEVEIDFKALNDLLKKFRQYADMTAPLSACDCKTCDRVGRLFQIVKALKGRKKLIDDMWNRDSATLSKILQLDDMVWRDRVVKESHGWESHLDDSFNADTDFVPAPFDL